MAFSASSWADIESANNFICKDLLLNPPAVLEQTPTRLFPIELRIAGQLYQPGTKLSPLTESGLYHYIITEQNELLLTPSYIGQRLATHKSLVAYYQKDHPSHEEPRVVAAGDMIIAFGRLVFIDNRSGNFRGGEENLNYAAQVLRDFGIPFTSETDVHNHDPLRDKQARGHTPEGRAGHKFTIDIRREIRKTPNGPELLALYEELGSLLMDALETTGPNNMIYQLIDIKMSIPDFEPFVQFIYPMQSAITVDGLSFGLWRSLKGSSPARLGPLAAGQIRRISKALEQRLSPAHIAALEDIAKRSQALGTTPN